VVIFIEKLLCLVGEKKRGEKEKYENQNMNLFFFGYKRGLGPKRETK
jgi:hypothetical protein